MSYRSISIGALLCLLPAILVSAEMKPLAEVNSPGIERDPWLSPDGYTLYFASNRDGGDFNIYTSRWDGQAFSSPERLSSLINSEYDETQPSLSADGHWLLFVSHRGRFWRGPWISQRQPDGSWGKAVFTPPVEQTLIYDAVIGADGRTVFFKQKINKNNPEMQIMCMEYNPAGRFWNTPSVHDGQWPRNEVPGARWRFEAKDGDIYFEPAMDAEPKQVDQQERLNFVAASSLYGNEDEDYWISEGQNLVDDLEDTSWISKAGKPVNQQWVLLALNGRVRYVPGLSRIDYLRIHHGPVEATNSAKSSDARKKTPTRIIPENAGPGSRPTRLRILGGTDRNALRELAVAVLNLNADSPWHKIPLQEPTWLRYLRIEVMETEDSGSPYVAFNEVQAIGAGLSAPRPTHHVGSDESNNITVDGKPFFPIYMYYSYSEQQYADWGFTSTLEGYDVAPDSARLAIMDRAEDLGLKIISHIPNVDTEADRKRARNQVLAAMHHPALLGYLMSDEAGHSEPTMQADERRAALIHQYDPHHFTMLNDLYPTYYPRSAKIVDVFSIDPYPNIVGQPYSYQGFAVDAAYKAVEYKKPVLVVNPSWGPIISGVENRLNVYLALIHGAKGISWYAIGVRNDYPDHWASILRCVSEIQRLKPVLFAPNTPADSPLLTHSTIENPGARIDVMIKEVGGEVWMLTANCEPREAKVRFSFGWGDNIVIREIMTDHPQAWSMQKSDFTSMDGWPPPEGHEPIRGARPIDLTYGAYGVRVFRMKPSGRIGPHCEPQGQGTPLAMVNESMQRKTVEQIKKLRDENKIAEAKAVMDRFWTQYRDRVSVDDLAALMDEVTDKDTGAEEILAGYGRLADEHPDARNWPKWVFTVVQAMVKENRADEAKAWMDKLSTRTPKSLWRANAEALVDPASVRAGHKPWVLARKVDQPPVIDGELNESCWENRISFKNTVFLDESKKPQETEFAVAHDSENLYFGVKLIEPEMARIRKNVDKDDRSVWDDDCIGIYLDPRLDFASYMQIMLNAIGAKWDGWGGKRGGGNAGSLNLDIERKAVLKDNAWQIEIRIPVNSIKKVTPPSSGTVWGLGLMRWRHVEGALYTVWGNEQGTSLDGWPDMLGFLVFE